MNKYLETIDTNTFLVQFQPLPPGGGIVDLDKYLETIDTMTFFKRNEKRTEQKKTGEKRKNTRTNRKGNLSPIQPLARRKEREKDLG